MQCHRIRMVFIIGAVLLAAGAFAQDYEVRTFLASPETAAASAVAGAVADVRTLLG